MKLSRLSRQQYYRYMPVRSLARAALKKVASFFLAIFILLTAALYWYFRPLLELICQFEEQPDRNNDTIDIEGGIL